MLVDLGTKRLKNNRIKVKTGSSLCLQRISHLLSLFIYLLHVLLYETLWRIHCKLHS